MGIKELAEPAWFVSISNTPTYGGGLKIAPQASITDGQLDITYLGSRSMSRLQLVRHFPKILAGDHVHMREINIFKTSQLQIETGHSQPIYADGEFIASTPCEVRTAPHALNLVHQKILSVL